MCISSCSLLLRSDPFRIKLAMNCLLYGLPKMISFADSLAYMDLTVFFLITTVYAYLISALLKRSTSSTAPPASFGETSRESLDVEVWNGFAPVEVETKLDNYLEQSADILTGSAAITATENGFVAPGCILVQNGVDNTKAPPADTAFTFDAYAPVVIDLGSGMVKAGSGGVDQAPRIRFKNIYGRPKYHKPGVFGPSKVHYVGEETEPPKRGILSLSYPMEKGTVANWDQVEEIVSHVFERLEVPSETHSVVFTSCLNERLADRESITRMFFKKFRIPALCMVSQCHSALLASGKSTALIVQCGDGESRVVPFVEGSVFESAITTLDFAGRNLTEHLADLLNDRGKFTRSTTAQLEMIRDMKERLSYVAMDCEEETCIAKTSAAVEDFYELSDGQTICLDEERFLCMEPLFRPSLLGGKLGALQEIIRDAVAACDEGIQRDLWRNIVLVGGTTMCPGFENRLFKEITRLAPSPENVGIIASPDREDAAWKGSLCAASSGTFSKLWTAKAQWEGGLRL